MVTGKTVVDLRGGRADRARSREWRQDSLVNVWSATKGVVALAMFGPGTWWSGSSVKRSG
ncbi:serine hydrolase [Mesorhizobium sp. B2-3-11]|uniref:serine hydrolase n=1 Tax=Mesorhizobium sp. B2-3-11 TaxID=2589953 RepID=UPI001FED33BC|nr:serine hydrolase [Mesorhizobium sp. B2-3-11]